MPDIHLVMPEHPLTEKGPGFSTNAVDLQGGVEAGAACPLLSCSGFAAYMQLLGSWGKVGLQQV